MKTLAVTGAAGFVGRHVVAAALNDGWAVRCLVRDVSAIAPAENLSTVSWNLEAVNQPDDFLAGCDAICHAAAFIPPDFLDAAAAEKCLLANAVGTLNLLRAAKKADVKSFVHISAGNAYVPGMAAVKEDAPLYPSGHAPYYLTSKLAADLFVEHWGHSPGFATCNLRVSSPYGPGMKAGGVIAKFVQAMRSRQLIILQDGGNYGVDLVYVDDVAFAVLKAIAVRASSPLNIGSGIRVTLRELAQELDGLLGGSNRIEVTPGASGGGFSPLDIGRAKAELEYRPTPLREGLARYIASLPDIVSSA